MIISAGRFISAILVLLLAGSPCLGQQPVAGDQADVIAFSDVTVVPMDRDGIIEHQLVIIRGGRIEYVGPAADVAIPEDALVIDGTGKYLMPGLADMHAHIEHEDALVLLLANGVTTVRNMWGFAQHLVWKDRIQNGEIIGPRIYTAGPIIDGPPGIWDGSVILDNPEDAEPLVIKQKEDGYDFIKVYYLGKESLDALIAAGRKHNMPVIGHASDDMGIEGVLTSGQYSIEHLDGYWKMLEADDSPYRSETFDHHSYIMTWNHIDERKMPAAAALTASSGIWNCATLVVYQRNASPAMAESLYTLPEMKYMDPVSLASWDPATYFATKNMTEEEWQADRNAYFVLTTFTGYLHRAGARLLLGTDTPNPFVVPGFSIHTELQNFILAGLSPYEAIKTGTYNAADCLGELDRSGTIAVGKRADLILLEDNPLEDVANITHRSGVMAQGRWFPEQELHDRLEEIVSSYTPPEDRFTELPKIDAKGELVRKNRYELRYNDIPFGGERYALYALDNNRYELISQTITDRPYATKTTVTMTLDSSYVCINVEYEHETSTGANHLKFVRSNDRLRITGELMAGEKVNREKSISGKELISPPRASISVSAVPVMASFVQIARRLSAMEIGDSLEIRNSTLQTNLPYGLLEEVITIRRAADAEEQVDGETVPVRVYSCNIASPNVSIPCTLITDAAGRIVSLEIEQQIGVLSIFLVEDK